MNRFLPQLAVVLLVSACNAQPDAATNEAIASVAPQPGNAIEDAPADEGVMAGATDGQAQAPRQADAEEERYLGRWTGVEGTYLTVSRRAGGGVTVDMQWDLDNKGTFDGSVTAEGLRFIRGGVPETAVRTDGDATGLKWLAGKTDCLTVKSGEGYCRG